MLTCKVRRNGNSWASVQSAFPAVVACYAMFLNLSCALGKKHGAQRIVVGFVGKTQSIVVGFVVKTQSIVVGFVVKTQSIVVGSVVKAQRIVVECLRLDSGLLIRFNA